MKTYRPGHVWEELEDVEFLYKLGAVGRSSNGKMHPTAAGLLMFGYEYEIVLKRHLNAQLVASTARQIVFVLVLDSQIGENACHR